jgi:hypothetical protein
MTSSVQTKYDFYYPLDEQGMIDGCQQLEKTLQETRSAKKLKINLIFESKEQPKTLHSAEYRRKKITSELTCCGLKGPQQKAIMNVFKQLDIKINSTTQDGGQVVKTAQGGRFVGGDSVSLVGVSVDLQSMKVMFPSKTDEELRKLFG